MAKIPLRRFDYPNDVRTIQASLKGAGFVDCTASQACELWRAYSASLFAVWLTVDPYSASAIVSTLTPFIAILDEEGSPIDG